MAQFPGSIFSQTDPVGNDYVSASGTALGTYVDHGQQHKNLNDEVNGLEAWLGSNSASNGVFAGYTAGQTPLSINTGTLGTIIAKGTINNSIMGTPAITGGTHNNGVFGSATLQAPTFNGLGTNSGTIINGVYNNPTMGTPAITSGTINNATLGTPTLQVPYRARAYLTTAGSIASGVDTIIPLDTIDYDSNNNFGTATHTYIVPVTGYYLIAGMMGFVDNSMVSGKRIAASIYYNGTNQISQLTYTTGSAGVNTLASGILKLTANGTLALYGFQETGGSVGLLNLSRYTFLSIHLLSQ